MISGRPEGKTRTVGIDQKYGNLHMRDEVVEAEYGPANAMCTIWWPTRDELRALLEGHPVKVVLLGDVMCPIRVAVGDVEEVQE